MNPITVGMADLKVTDDPNGVLVTYALGSCMAVLVHDVVQRTAGMIHYMLPLSSITP
jgi:chemotaxis protein CheD